MTEVTLNNRQEIEPVLKPGQFVTVEPTKKYGSFTVPRSQPIEWLPPVDVNLASPTSTLGAFTYDGNPPTLSARITDLDMPKRNLAMYWLVAKDDVRFTINQPAAVGRFVNKNGSQPFGIETQSFAKLGMWGSLPQVWIYEDVTPMTIKATAKWTRATQNARFTAFGFRYILEPTDMVPGSPSLVIRVEGS